MAKKNTGLIIGIIILVGLALVVFMPNILPSFTIVNDINMARTCEIATNTYTEGAQAGQCYVYTSGSTDSLVYINSVVESTRYGPTGLEYFCQIDVTQDKASVLGCDTAVKNGDTIKVCQYDEECTSGSCANYMCQGTLSRECSVIGDKRCFSGTQTQTCLSDYTWSGILPCASGLSCVNGACLTTGQIDNCGNDICDVGETVSACPSDCTTGTTINGTTTCPTGTTKCSDNVCRASCGTGDTGGFGGLDTTTIIWIIGGLGAALVVFALIK